MKYTSAVRLGSNFSDADDDDKFACDCHATIQEKVTILLFTNLYTLQL